MAMVTELDISHNQLTKLPASIGGMLLLAKLDVSHNALIDLPDEIKSLSNLQVPFLLSKFSVVFDLTVFL